MKVLRKIFSKHIFIIFLISIYIPITVQSESTKPEKVYRLRKVMMPSEWYSKQAELWKKELDKDSKNIEAWNNYYLAVRYASPPFGKDKDLKKVKDNLFQEIEREIPDSYLYYHLKYQNNQNWIDKDISLLEKAYNLNPDDTEIMMDFVVYYEVNGDIKKSKEFCSKVYKSRDIAPGCLEYHYNVLMSTEKNAILFTNGDLDTYSCWLLQSAKGIREDVTVLNISLARINSYLELKLNEKNIKIDASKLPKGKNESFVPGLCNAIVKNNPEIPIYFALTVYKNAIESLKDNIYIVGLAHKYSTKRFDNVALLRKNVEKKFRLDYLKYDWYNETDIYTKTIKRLNQNYIASFLMLYDHYKASGENSKADYFKTFTLELAAVSPQKTKQLEEYFSSN